MTMIGLLKGDAQGYIRIDSLGRGIWAVLRGSMYSFVATTISKVGVRDVGSLNPKP